MINDQLLSPNSVAVVGGSEHTDKPGGATLHNLISNNYSGKLYVVNPKADTVQGIKAYKDVDELPEVECAILAIPAKFCLTAVETLCNKKSCKAIIILSAGFHEDSEEGAKIEAEITKICNSAGTSLIGPNCIGVMTPSYTGVFTKPIPHLSPDGVSLISGSGATIVFILEAASQLGLRFNQIFSVGNCAQNGVEDVLEYLDETYVPGKSSSILMLYIESINNPNKLLKHASSLIKKGAKIAAIKAGSSEAGSRAASSHTGALASPDRAVSALFRKIGIVRCYSRTELVTVASAMTYPTPKGRRVAIVTHAGGPAVMQTDVFSNNGIEIPPIKGEKAKELLGKLFPGSSVSNPIDFLATGTTEQLGHILDACENDFDVDAITVIFGNPGLTEIFDVYSLLLEKIRNSKKPIYPVLPSTINAAAEIKMFQDNGGISFPDEVALASAIVKIVNTPKPIDDSTLPAVDKKAIRDVVNNCKDGYLNPNQVQMLLDAAGISRVKEIIIPLTSDISSVVDPLENIPFPIAAKVIGPIHKSDVCGVSLNIANKKELKDECKRLLTIPEATGVLIQPMISGIEIFIGAKRENNFGHQILCGLGGIFIEALKDTTSALSPVSKIEANEMIKGLRGYKILEGIRGKKGIDLVLFSDTIRRVSALCSAAPEISEMDINPLMANSKEIIAVDTRIKIEK